MAMTKQQSNFKQYLVEYFKRNWQPLTIGFISGLVVERLLPIILATLAVAAVAFFFAQKKKKAEADAKENKA